MVSSGRPDRFSVSSRASSASLSDDEDAITPCPLELPAPVQPGASPVAPSDSPCESQRQHEEGEGRPSVESTRSAAPSEAASALASDGDLEADDRHRAQLWRRMLTIQRVFHCYNSARMSAALSPDGSGDMEAVPSKACLDLLNDSISRLPDEIRQQLEAYLSGRSKRRPRKRASWKAMLANSQAGSI